MPKNYCQNLWAQFAKVDKVQKNCAGVLNLAIKEGEVHFANVNMNLSELESEIQIMQEAWDNSFVTLPGGKLFFGPEYEAFEKLCADNGIDSSQYYKTDGFAPFDLTDAGFLRRLDITIKKVKDLSHLKYLTNLEQLLIQTQASDFSSLASLSKLQHLNLSLSGITDVSPLRGLVNLRYLTISHTQVSDISPLSNLASLTDLLIRSTRVADISVALEIPNLKYLSIVGTTAGKRPPEVVEKLRQRGVEVA